MIQEIAFSMRRKATSTQRITYCGTELTQHFKTYFMKLNGSHINPCELVFIGRNNIHIYT
jgi:hypothetical protein